MPKVPRHIRNSWGRSTAPRRVHMAGDDHQVRFLRSNDLCSETWLAAGDRVKLIVLN